MGNVKKKNIVKIILIVLALLAVIAATVYLASYKEEVPKQYADPMRVYLIILIFVTVLLLIFYRYAVRSDEGDLPGSPDGKAAVRRELTGVVLTVIAIGLVLRLVLCVTAPQCDIDTNLFKFWGTYASDKGLFHAYEGSNIDYPPLHIYTLWFTAKISNLFKITDTAAYTMLVKLPAILSDCAIALFIYRKFMTKLSKQWVLFFLAVWMFNPLSIIDSACWGQVDSTLALFLLLGCYYMENEKFFKASLVMALGVLFKPQAIILMPILFYALIRSRKVRSWLIAAATFIVTFFAISLPFNITMGLVDITLFGKTLKLPWIFSLYLGTADHYSYTTVNSLNYWFILGKNWVADSQEFLGLTFYKWGMIAIVIISATIWVFYLISKKRGSLPYIMGATLLSVVVTFGPRMHERYFFPVVVLLLAAMIKDNDKLLLGIYSGTSIFGFMTVAEIMTDLAVGSNDAYRNYYWPSVTPPRMVMAIGNVLMCLALFAYTVSYTFRHKALEKEELKIYKEKDGTEHITEIKDAKAEVVK
ncbi:MAG: hypothetical protein II748_02335 [Clostridia bacterium]|nr:hypothetical protein [Clostridia bacterium]